ncbi:MAG: DUF952 domain-containing protein [Chitinophagaceae bacterium]|nr:DUF952 domain-containing protein [Chitinophagaceae bacterium]
MPLIYHITTNEEWKSAQEAGQYESSSLKEEGFIHCSEDRQVADVLKRYFSGKSDLVKLTIDTEKLTSQLIYDWSNAIEDTFPHIYGPINLAAVVAVDPVHN